MSSTLRSDQGDAALSTRGPFHLEATVRVLQRRPANRVDIWEQGRYLRVSATADGLALVEVENRGTIAEPDVRFAIRSGNPTAAARQGIGLTLRKVLGLDIDPEPFQRLAAAEPTLRAMARALRGMRPPQFGDLFEAFANVVPFQQLSLEAGVAIVGHLVERFGESLKYGSRRFQAIPTARAIAEARLTALRACGLSSRKAETLRHLARAIESGELVEERIARMTTNAALQTLRDLPGIGPWSAGLVLLRGLGRLDVFPPGDVGATRGLSALMHVEPGAPLGHVVERFGDLRGYLYFCALGASLMKKGLIHAAPSSPHRRYSGSV
ncbi:MAG TPA: AlkA N-terminal domain-containing protein [Burkholderiales bacterium]|nr:AlkA N-terminal domain-containing protein [Burkholderiales bacterium]